MDQYKAPESDVNAGQAGPDSADLVQIEQRRSLMMRAFWIQIIGVIIGLTAIVGLGEAGQMVGIGIYAIASIAGLVTFVLMLMLTSTLHGGGWVAANLVGSLILPIYALVAIFMLNSHAKARAQTAL